MKKLPFITAILAAAALSASAELKIATVDMETVIVSHPQTEENKANLVKLQKEFEAERDVKRQKIQDLYKQLETMLTETAANLYLQDLANLVAIRSDLTGYQFYPIYAMDFSTVAYSK